MGIRSFPAVKQSGSDVNHPPAPLCQGSRKGMAIPLLPLCAFMAGYRVNFTVHFTFTKIHDGLY